MRIWRARPVQSAALPAWWAAAMAARVVRCRLLSDRTAGVVGVVDIDVVAVAAAGDRNVEQLAGVSTATTVHMNPDGTYSLTYRPDIADRYDYNGNFPNSSLANVESNFLHYQGENGRVRPFLITGSGSPRVISGRVQ